MILYDAREEYTLNSAEQISVKMSMFHFLCRMTEGLDSAEAFEYFGKKYTLGEVKTQTRKVASALHNFGIRKGDKIVLSLITTPESIFLMYACGLIGAVPVLTDVRYSKTELSDLCDNISPKLMFISDWQGGMVRQLHELHKEVVFVVVSPCAGFNGMPEFFRSFYRLFSGNACFMPGAGGISWKRFIEKANETPFTENCEDCDVIFTTSGTTGKRKFVVMNQEKLNLSAQASIRCGDDYSAIKTFLSIMPLFTLYGWVLSVHFPLCMGKYLVLYPIHNDKKIARLILKKKPNAFCGVPHHYETIMKARELKKADLSFLKYICSAGESFGTENQIKMNCFLRERNSEAMIFQAYGMTETGGGACKQSKESYVEGAVGRPLPGVRIKIVNDADGITEVSKGMCGEVCISTPYQTSGYYRDKTATENLLRRHPDGIDWIHSGDLGHLDQNGNLFIDGRKKRMVVASNGTKVFLGLVEDKVKTLPGVTDCALVSYIEKGTAFVRKLALFLVSDRRISNKKMKQNVIEICKNELPEYLIPNDMIFCDSIPRNSSGKHDLSLLEKEAFRRSQKVKQ